MRRAAYAGTSTPALGRGAVAVFDVEDNDALHRILNEWADIIPAHFDTYPLDRFRGGKADAGGPGRGEAVR